MKTFYLLGVPEHTSYTIEMITFPLAVVIGLCTSAFSVGGFYLLTNWRLKQLEKNQDAEKETRERIARIEERQNTVIQLLQNHK